MVPFEIETRGSRELKKLAENLGLLSKLVIEQQLKERATMTITRGFEKTPEATYTPGESLFFKPKAGEQHDLMCLIGPEDFTRCKMHEHWDRMRMTPPQKVIFTVCTGKPDCPGCLLDNTPALRGFLPVIMEERADDGSLRVKVLNMTKTMIEQFIDGADLFDNDILGRIVRVKRVGKGKNDTRYTVMVTGKKPDEIPEVVVPDVDKAIGPFDRESIIEKYHSFGVQIPGEAAPTAGAAWSSSEDVPEEAEGVEFKSSKMWADA